MFRVPEGGSEEGRAGEVEETGEQDGVEAREVRLPACINPTQSSHDRRNPSIYAACPHPPDDFLLCKCRAGDGAGLHSGCIAWLVWDNLAASEGRTTRVDARGFARPGGSLAPLS